MEDYSEQHQDNAVANSPYSPSNEDLVASLTKSPLTEPNEDPVSDNEASEGPVREKLKKTSIASIPRQTDTMTNSEDDIGEPTPSIAQVLDSPAFVSENAAAEIRGRPMRKRSFDETVNEKAPQGYPEQDQGGLSGRERKRSKEFDGTRTFGESEREQKPVTPPVLEDVVQHAHPRESSNESIQASRNSQENGELAEPARVNSNPKDQEMQDSVFSPRKKRSRDQLDAESQREQKIAATEELKAHRRSEEHERQKEPKAIGEDAVNVNPSAGKDGDDVISGTIKVYRAPSSTFGFASLLTLPQDEPDTTQDNPPIISPVTSSGDTQPTHKPPPVPEKSSLRPESKALGYDFSTSAFGAFSQSSASPFATSSLSGSGLRTFASPPPSNSKEAAPVGQSQEDSKEASSNGFMSVHIPATQGPNNGGLPSLFGSGSTNSNGTSFGGPSPFAKPFGGPKLTSFANPVGGTTPFGTGGPIKPIGATKDSDDDRSGSEDEGQVGKEFETEEEETDPRFQYQESTFLSTGFLSIEPL